jgi:hypothetical protein
MQQVSRLISYLGLGKFLAILGKDVLNVALLADSVLELYGERLYKKHIKIGSSLHHYI